MSNWVDAEGNHDFDADAGEAAELWEFSEQDRKIITLMMAYDEARILLGKERDVDALWRTITAADALRTELGMSP